jgi:hypothetical protein
MKKLNDPADLVNATLEHILDWAEEMTKKGLYDPNTGRHLRTALKSLVSILDEDEPKDPLSLQAAMDSIAERWARANKSNPSTMRTYRQRAGALVDDFITFMKTPAAFKGRGGGTPKKEKKEERRTSPEPVIIPEAPVVDTAFNTFRLPDGRVFRYSVPENFTIEDLRRVAFHLLPATSDFDPMRPGGGFSPMSAALDVAPNIQ